MKNSINGIQINSYEFLKNVYTKCGYDPNTVKEPV